MRDGGFNEYVDHSAIIDAEDGVTTWEYDRNNRPIKVTDADGQVTRFEFDAGGRRTKSIFPNGVWTEYRYDASSQLTHMVTRDRTNLTLQGWYYQYDLRGNRKSKTDHAGNVEAYLYDALGRLTQTTYPDQRVVKWTYDAVGNRLTQDDNGSVTTYTYNAANQITGSLSATAETVFFFDANGNMTHKWEPSGVTQYTWDFENRLRQVASPSGVTNFGYNADGIRVFKESGGIRTDYLIDTVAVLAEYEAGVRKSAYVLGSRIDEIVSQTNDQGKYWYLADALGSVTALTDTAGRVIKTYRYGAWGEDAGVTGPDIRNAYRWTGREWDPTGLQYNRARYYASALGRWVNEDPFNWGKIASGGADIPRMFRLVDEVFNRYSFSSANPVNSVDPYGLISILLILVLLVFVTAIGYYFREELFNAEVFLRKRDPTPDEKKSVDCAVTALGAEYVLTGPPKISWYVFDFPSSSFKAKTYGRPDGNYKVVVIDEDVLWGCFGIFNRVQEGCRLLGQVILGELQHVTGAKDDPYTQELWIRQIYEHGLEPPLTEGH
jgi:RHS repeat-associated protein